MSWFTLQRDAATLRGWDGGEGLPVIFQHGLGGDEAQVAEVFPDGPGFRRLTLECRGQGQSGMGDLGQLSIQTFAGDILAFADQQGVERFVIGGISMGAAIALGIAVRHPDRIKALILARPAWLSGRAPANMQPFSELASYLPEHRIAEFEASATAQRLAREAPDNLLSLRKFFSVKDRAATAALLAAIARDGPDVSETEMRAIAVPTLIIGHRVDAVHPLEFAQRLAGMISGAKYAEITPKAADKPRHVAEFSGQLKQFLSSITKGEQP